MRSNNSNIKRRVAGLVAITLAAVTGCVTYIEPTSCEPGATACAGIHDARFCEYLATQVEGSACARLGIVETRPFCVVSTGSCVETNYALKDQDCRVLRYEAVRDAMRAECPTGAPTFVKR
jgi:hypothetical protein